MSLFETRAQMFFHRTWISFSVIKEIQSDWNVIKNLLLIYRHIYTYTHTHPNIYIHTLQHSSTHVPQHTHVYMYIHPIHIYILTLGHIDTF